MAERTDKEQAVAYLTGREFDGYLLDDEVHDRKSSEGTDINNAGREAQIRYLLGEADADGMIDGDLVTWLEVVTSESGSTT